MSQPGGSRRNPNRVVLWDAEGQMGRLPLVLPRIAFGRTQ